MNAHAPAWLTVPDDVNALRPDEWAADVARSAAGEVSVAGLPAAELAREFGTPLFVLSEEDFRRRARLFRDTFAEAFKRIGAEAEVYYAGKSFLCTEVARWVESEGLGLDTCSAGEMLVARRAGFPAARVALHGNNKSAAEIARALDDGVGRIVSDSLDELSLVERIARERGVVAPVMLRLKTGVQAHTHESIATAHEDQKFGLSMASDEGRSEAHEAAARAIASEHLELLGVHAHVGSQIFEPTGFEQSAARLIAFLAEIRDEHGVELSELDLGGGHGIAYTPEDTPRPVAELAEASADVVARECAAHSLAVPSVSVEPGRAIVGPTTFTLYEAGTVKDVRLESGAGGAVRRYVAVDGGMSDNPRPVLYGADYSVTLASRTSAAEPVLSRVVGKHCESGDIVVRYAYLPGDVAAGDLLAVPATGAYCWALSSNYNYLPRPAVVAVRGGEARLIVRRETEDDLLARDIG
ncbi:diaminopimelate decarboxylase [Falsarthrobacter nasiphocae]|uniref:Diaminopimelate decarboxylase n=1 Tax=Falsarthrobacter nasiphocae TaxID=189863 RepID=A0AAE3YIF5_9MICC|nr:diaminopimelate decarboxylase [Falsarthrobacter nasiphocae]MDR6892759.1 diaminopimelate decarboxylase [Falsarthrobacter nasiphocae]